MTRDEKATIDYLREKLGEDILAAHSLRGDDTIVVPRARLKAVIRFLREDPVLRLDFLTDITAVDYWRRKSPRFEVVYHLFSMTTHRRLRVKTPVPEDDPVVDSLVPFWRSADWLEREVWDMYGIRFSGHPDLRRVLLYEEFRGHPLRKDYPVNEEQPLVPLRQIEGTFVDERSERKRLRLRLQLGASR
ncbi:MAG TPA: NADH-quinone oxidoreductase subunit C [Candidatus Acidoferrales bacterium]|nr:NADH-quinone oxidoreductase subunit C [Candidatus Acidoferrales bacterium]